MIHAPTDDEALDRPHARSVSWWRWREVDGWTFHEIRQAHPTRLGRMRGSVDVSTARQVSRARGTEMHRHAEAVRTARVAAAMPSRPTEPGDYWTSHGWRQRWAEAGAALLAWGLE